MSGHGGHGAMSHCVVPLLECKQSARIFTLLFMVCETVLSSMSVPVMETVKSRINVPKPFPPGLTLILFAALVMVNAVMLTFFGSLKAHHPLVVLQAGGVFE